MTFYEFIKRSIALNPTPGAGATKHENHPDPSPVQGSGLKNQIDAEKVAAKYEKGILKITLPQPTQRINEDDLDRPLPWMRESRDSRESKIMR